MSGQENENDESLFDETLDAAKIFDDLAKEVERTQEPATPTEAFADEYVVPDEVESEPFAPTGAGEAEGVPSEQAAAAPPEAPEPVGAPAAVAPAPVGMGPAEVTISELFRNVVSHSPSWKMRVEDDSIGALFRRFIRSH